MFKIYTSYFEKTKELEKLNIQPISVALYTPDLFNNPIMYRLVPSANLLQNEKKQYAIDYIETILKNQDPQFIHSMLQSWLGGKDVALLSFENPEDFSHRHLISAWLNKHLNLGVKEYVW